MIKVFKKTILLFTIVMLPSFAENVILKKGDLVEKFPIVGTFSPLHVSKISSQVEGKILEMPFSSGQKAEKGAIVAKLDPVFLKLDLKKQEAFLEGAKADYLDAQLDFKRKSALWNKKEKGPSISQKEFDDARLQLKGKKASLNQALVDVAITKRRLVEMDVRAPFAGVVTKSFVDIGEMVSAMPNNPIIELMDISKLILEFTLPQTQKGAIAVGDTLSFSIVGDEKEYTGKVTTIVPRLDEMSRSFKCSLVVDNSAGDLFAGTLVQGKIEKIVKKETFFLSKEYLIKKDGKYHLFVERDGKKVLLPIETGLSTSKEVEVLSKISDKIVR